SLSDFVCFGVSPALILYLWTMKDAGKFGWVLVMFFSICCGLRLARFNVMLDDEDAPAWQSRFFTGVPAPAAGGLVLLPMVLSFQFGNQIFREPWLSGLFLFIIAGLMVSSIPTYSFKKLKISRKWILPTMLITAALVVFLINAPWHTLSVIGLVYLLSIPMSIRTHRAMSKGKPKNNA
ncbi:MAG: CDP-diacylglycerol O-phosphatidyltransferase, partial [Rhodospirillales bacterium]